MGMNTGGKFYVDMVKEPRSKDFDDYDNLPPEARKVIREASYNVACGHINTHDPDILLAGLERGTRLNARSAYGPDHPQAG